MQHIVRQREEGGTVKRIVDQRSNSEKVNSLEMKKAKVKTEDISYQLNVPENILKNWFRDSKAAVTWLDLLGKVSRPASLALTPRSNNQKITDNTKPKIKSFLCIYQSI